MPGVDVMERMKNRASPHFCISGDDAACHPVMAVDDEATTVSCANIGNDLIDQCLLKLDGVQNGISGIGICKVVEYSRVHQVDVFRIYGVGDLVPLIIVQVIFLLETTAQVNRGKMALYISLCQPLAKG